MTEPSRPERPPPAPLPRRGAERRAHLRAQRAALMARLPPEVRAALDRPPHVTRLLVGALVAVFVLQHLLGMLESPILMMRYGANVPGLVFAGEWWRLVSANFLHGSALHLAFNGWALVVLGGVLERVLDGRRLALIYLASALLGAATSAVFSGALLAVGASTAVFGLLGALAAVQWRAGPRLHPLFQQSRRWWIIILVINGGLSFLVPRVDGAAHVGGFVAGGLLGLWLGSARQPLLAPTRDRLVLGVAAGLTALFGVGLGLAALHARDFDDAATARAVAAVTAHADSAGDVLNFFAWEVAIDPRAGRLALEAAAAAAAEAASRSPSEAEIVDTLAQARYRLGDFEAALRLELGVLARLPEAFYASQAGRFGAALYGQQAATGQVPAVVAGLKLTARPGGQRLALAWPDAAPAVPWLVFGRAREGEQTVGHFVLAVTPGREPVLPRDDAVGRALPESATLEALWAVPEPPEDRTFKSPVAPHRWRYWPVDPRATELDAALPVPPAAGATPGATVPGAAP